jgi:hypothetical protein
MNVARAKAQGLLRWNLVSFLPMPEMKAIAVKDLSLDLSNFRTIRQSSEAAALEAMVATSPDRFWALAESLLRDGYLPTDTIIVLRNNGTMTVREGNRRVAALKLIHGLLPRDTVSAPSEIGTAIDVLSKSWKDNNQNVPCAIYDLAEKKTVDRIVALAHGKGEKAGRDQWNAIARARHNRDENGASEPALDLLEKYLIQGKNVTAHQRAHWAGDYSLSVLAEAMKRLAPRLGVTSSGDLATSYPGIPDRNAVEGIIHDIGLEKLGFETIRDKDADFGSAYGMKAAARAAGGPSGGGTGSPAKAGGKSAHTKPTKPVGKTSTKQRDSAITSPKATRQYLVEFAVRGKKREKVETLRLEAIKLDLNKTPLAFCFVLRSMFEVSAKAYCADYASAGLSTTKANGQDKALADVLREITQHLTKNNADKAMVKALHGAMAELGKATGLLSVTSMNQLVHNPRFAIAPSDVAMLFCNISPLLEEMNS